MLGNHAIHHCQGVGVGDRPTGGDIIAAFLNESGKACFLFCGVPNGLGHKPCPAAPLVGDDLVDQFQSFGVDPSGNNGMLGHRDNVSLVYK